METISHERHLPHQVRETSGNATQAIPQTRRRHERSLPMTLRTVPRYRVTYSVTRDLVHFWHSYTVQDTALADARNLTNLTIVTGAAVLDLIDHSRVDLARQPPARPVRRTLADMVSHSNE